MSKLTTTVVGLAIVAVAVYLSGCTEAKKPTSKPVESEAADDHADHDHEGHDHDADADHDHEGHDHDAHAGHDHPATEVEKAMAELPESERTAAEKQKNCPVTGEALGSMGKPYKVTVEGRDVYLCCQGCEDKILGDPEKYLGKLKE